MSVFNSVQGSGRNSGNETNLRSGREVDCMTEGEKRGGVMSEEMPCGIIKIVYGNNKALLVSFVTSSPAKLSSKPKANDKCYLT